MRYTFTIDDEIDVESAPVEVWIRRRFSAHAHAKGRCSALCSAGNSVELLNYHAHI